MVEDTDERARLWIEILTLRVLLDVERRQHPFDDLVSEACAEVLRGRYALLEQLDRG